jgi:hypothetical protein
MVERKKHLSNVAFGGAWSEEISARDEVQAVLEVLTRAAAECGERDVRDAALADALCYVYREVEKGPMLVAGFQKALLEPLPDMREAHVKRYVAMIVNWAGY